MIKAYVISFIISVALLTIIAIIINEYEKEKQNEEEMIRKNEILLKQKRAMEKRERELSNALIENENCLKVINKKDLINCINYNIEKPIDSVGNTLLNRKSKVSVNQKYALLSDTKKAVENLFLKTKNIKLDSVEEKINLNQITKLSHPIFNERVHFNILLDLFKYNPFNKLKFLKENVEELQYDLIKELTLFNEVYKEEMRVKEAFDYICLELTQQNKELILNKEIVFNGITSSNSIIFVSEKGIFILNLIPYNYNNTYLEIKDNLYTINKEDGSSLKFDLSLKNNEDVNSKYIEKILNKKIPIHHIYVVCNNEMFIKNKSDKIFTKYKTLCHSIDKISSDTTLDTSLQKEIISKLKENIITYSVEDFIDRKYRLLSLITNLENSIEEYNYIELVFNKYKEIFEYNQNMKIYYREDLKRYLLRKEEG